MAVESVGNQKTIQEIIEGSSKKESSRNTGALGKDDFLKLLVTQLKYQDPLKPLEDKEFIAQMAQFSSLEQMQNMNSSMLKMQAFSLIGKFVAATSPDNSSEIVVGWVSSVKVNNGKTFVVVEGEDIPVDNITDITI